MLRTMLRLPDGTQLYSGADMENVIVDVKVTQQVNSGKELTLGSACAAMLEAELLTPNGGLALSTGQEIAAYKIDEDQTQHLLGLFTLEKPKKSTANTMTITAYDRITWLDKDLSSWLAGLSGWPYSLFTFANMVCNACGLVLKNDSIPNGEYLVQAFSAEGITGRKLMQWVAEAAGRFCRATPDGLLEFAWYTPSTVELTPGGDPFYYQNGLSFEDYSVMPIEKVQIRQAQDDVGVIWPNEEGEKNTYIISGNYLLTTTTTDALLPVAQTLYQQLKDITYTPCKVQLPARLDICAGDMVQITDRNGKSFSAYVMTKKQTGQRDTLECTGSYRRDSTSVINNQSFHALSGRMLQLQQTVEGFSVTASQIQGSAIYSTVDEFYLSASPEMLTGGAWSEEQPAWKEGKYLWRRSRITKGDGSVEYTPSENGVCITGNSGKDAVVCRVDSSAGYTLKAGETAVLTARIFEGMQEVDTDGKYLYTWYVRTDGGENKILGHGKSMIISEADYSKNMDVYFVCNKTHYYVDYIACDGTQYIDTGIVPNQDTRVVCEFLRVDGTGVYGARASVSSRNFSMRVINNKWQMGYANGVVTGSVTVDNEWHIADQNKNCLYMDGELVAEKDYEEFSAPYAIAIGAIRAGSLYYGEGSYRSCQIYDNGELVRDMAACVTADGMAGMFDKVTGLFYGNAGTGSFTYPALEVSE